MQRDTPRSVVLKCLTENVNDLICLIKFLEVFYYAVRIAVQCSEVEIYIAQSLKR